MLNFDLTEVKEIMSMILFGAAIFLFFLSRFLKQSKNKKLNKLATQLESVATATLAIRNIAQTAIAQAEQFLEYSVEDKKVWAKTHIKEYCIKNGIPYSDEIIDCVIEELTNLSKKINSKEQKQMESKVVEEQDISQDSD